MNTKLRWLGALAAVVVAGSLIAPVEGSIAASPQAGCVGELPPPKAQIDPTPLGVVVPPRGPKMIFAARDACNSIFVPNGMMGALDENNISGLGHDALDIALANHPNNGWGKPIYAGVHGRAYRSYQRIPDVWTDPQTGIKHDISTGGLLVEVRYYDADGVHVMQMFHFSRVNTNLRYFAPEYQGPGQWFPRDVLRSDEEMWRDGTEVWPDTIVGWMGYSGLNLDCVEAFDVVTGTVTECASWDRPHVHVQFYGGRVCSAAQTSEMQLGKVVVTSCTKQNIIDPAGWWAQVSGEWGMVPHFNVYTPLPGLLRYGPKSVFMVDAYGRPLFATS